MADRLEITPAQFAQQVKDRLALDQLIAEYVPSLRRSGNSLKGLCPFHKEKTPSFNVHVELGFYHCFGCGAHGDAIKFVQEIEKIDFMLALEQLARRAGLQMPRFGRGEGPARPEREEQLARLKAACAWAEAFFIEQLEQHPRGAVAREYLRGRGLTDEEIARYRLGYAPDGLDVLLREGERRGWSGETLAEAGLASRREQGGFLDRFRDRVIFPIADRYGAVVAFAGRLLDSEREAPKYINSAETPLFSKSRLLYGMALARDAIRESRQVILLEGYMDWIALHRRGLANALAGMGTALTEDQARLIRRIADRATLIYDGDEPGQKAAFRGTELLLRQGLEVRIVTLPAEHDPDTFLEAEGTQALRERIAEAPAAVSYFTARIGERANLSRPEGKADAVQQIAPLLLALGDPAIREGYLEQAAARFGLRYETLEAALRRRAPRRVGPAAEAGQVDAGAAPGEPGGDWPVTEQILLFSLLHFEARWELIQQIDAEWFTHEELRGLYQRIYEAHRDVREGADPPTDWFALCHTPAEEALLSRILLLPQTHFRGDVADFSHTLADAIQLQVLKLKRNWTQRKRRELARDLQMILDEHPLGRGQLAAIDELTRRQLQETAEFFRRNE
ncbi:MAG TPA: DNA primase [Candidatus Sumerlaeota bacterium]|nr:DNA primase [Candidatus Sumerlaeota bacterium]